jgi:hypothetical protein
MWSLIIFFSGRVANPARRRLDDRDRDARGLIKAALGRSERGWSEGRLLLQNAADVALPIRTEAIYYVQRNRCRSLIWDSALLCIFLFSPMTFFARGEKFGADGGDIGVRCGRGRKLLDVVLPCLSLCFK